MKNILFILYFIIYSCAPAFGAATTTITADSIRSSNRTKTWTPPSITDTLTGLTDVQTLTNKTLTSPTINTPLVDVDTFTEQGSTPATPAAGKRKVYAKSDGIYHLDSAGNERKVGSGSGGGDISYIVNGSADDANASIFVPYADTGSRPVDGTGGSPTVTTSISSVSPLNGTKSYLLTKPAANVQGQGWAVPFTVDLAYRAKSLKISVDVILNSGTYVPGNNSSSPLDGDVIWYIYDVTNSQLIEPSNIKMFSNSTTLSDKYEATFQTSATGSSYRLIAHISTTSASAYELKVDNVTVTPQVSIYTSSMSSAVDYVPTLSNATNVTIVKSTVTRRGDRALCEGYLTWSGAGAGGVFTVSLPPGLVIDTGKINPGVQESTLGHGQWKDNGTGRYHANVTYNVTTSVQFELDGSGPLNGTAFASGDILSYSFEVPILGWEASSRVSDGYQGRDIIIASAQQLTPTGTVGAAFNITKFPAVGIVTDTVSGYDATTGIYTVKTAGNYDAFANLEIQGNVSPGSITYALFTVNGTVVAQGAYVGSATVTGLQHQVIVSGSFYAKVGDQVSVRSWSNTGSPVYSIGNAGSSFKIVKIPNGSQAITSDATVNAIYTSTAAQSFTNGSNVIINMASREEDSHGGVTTGASWQFLCQSPGIYEMTITQTLAIGASTAYGLQHLMYKNGSASKYGPVFNGTTSSLSSNLGITSTMQVRLKSGDYITPYLYNFSGANKSASASANENHISIKKVGN